MQKGGFAPTKPTVVNIVSADHSGGRGISPMLYSRTDPRLGTSQVPVKRQEAQVASIERPGPTRA